MWKVIHWVTWATVSNHSHGHSAKSTSGPSSAMVISTPGRSCHSERSAPAIGLREAPPISSSAGRSQAVNA